MSASQRVQRDGGTHLNPSSWEEVGELQIQGHPQQQRNLR